MAVSVDATTKNIYVADSSTQAVYVITYPGGVKTLYKSLGYVPNGIAYTSQGLFVTTRGNVWNYNGANSYNTSTYNKWIWDNPFGIRYDGANYVIVADAGSNQTVSIRIYYDGNKQLFNQGGSSSSLYPTIHGLTSSYISQTNPVGIYDYGTNLISNAFSYPICLTADASNNLYVADYTKNAVYEMINPSSGSSYPISIVSVTQPTGITFLSSDLLVVVAANNGVGRVLLAR